MESQTAAKQKADQQNADQQNPSTERAVANGEPHKDGRPHDDREWLGNVAQVVAEMKTETKPAGRPGPNVDPFDQDIPLTDKPGLAGFIELLQRRRRGEYEVDEFGYDPHYGNLWWPIFSWLYKNYWRVETTGVENVPATGRGMIVANHSGGSYAWDAVMISTALHLEHRRPRYVHYVSTEFFYDTPFLSFDNRKKGAALACREDFVGLLERDLVVGVFPEGAKGFLKPSDKRYRVQRFGRGGFVQLAMMTRTPIVPVAVVGGEELHFSLGNSRLPPNLVNRSIPQERADSFPILLNMLPLPVKWRIEFCEPIDMSSYG